MSSEPEYTNSASKYLHYYDTDVFNTLLCIIWGYILFLFIYILSQF